MTSVLNKSLNFVIKQYQKYKEEEKENHPFIIGISGIQGSGKSTLTDQLVNVLKNEPYYLKATGFSLDDFYLTFKEQAALANKHPEIKLIEYRGSAGTHDLNLLHEILHSFQNQTGAILIPKFNKLLNGGRGDRVPIEEWKKVELPVDIIIIEGWMLGFSPLEEKIIQNIYNQDQKADLLWLNQINSNFISPFFRNHTLAELLFINNNLKKYSSIYQNINTYIILKSDNLSNVFEWREQQEINSLEKEGLNPSLGLDKRSIRKFVEKFMVSYELYLNNLYNEKTGKKLLITLDKSRKVVNLIEF